MMGRLAVLTSAGAVVAGVTGGLLAWAGGMNPANAILFGLSALTTSGGVIRGTLREFGVEPDRSRSRRSVRAGEREAVEKEA